MPGLRGALRRLPDTVFADLLESEDAYLLVLDLPGTTRDTVDVQSDDGHLTVEARREKDVPDGFTYRREDRSLFLDVDLPVPPDATGDGANAVVERGVLEITLPKMTAASRSIPVENAEE